MGKANWVQVRIYNNGLICCFAGRAGTKQLEKELAKYLKAGNSYSTTIGTKH